MDKPLSQYSREERAKIAKTAKRNINSECTLILTAGWGLLMVIFFIAGKHTFLPFSAATGIHPIGAWVVMCTAIILPITWLYRRQAFPIIEHAQNLSAQFLYEKQDKDRADQDAKIHKLMADEKDH